MAEEGDELLIREAFGDLRDATRPYVKPAEVSRLRDIVRRRRRRAGAAVSLCALAAVALTSFAILRSTSDLADDDQVGQAIPACPAAAGGSGLDVAVATTDIVLGRLGAGTKAVGWRLGEMTVRICNVGTVEAPEGTFKVRWLATVPGAGTMGQGRWAGCDYADHETEALASEEVAYYVVNCAYPRLAAGMSRAYTLDFNTLGDMDAGIDRPAVHYAEAAATNDVDTRNNRTEFKIRIG